MKQPGLKQVLETALKNDTRLITENGELNVAMVRMLADRNDEYLIGLLLENEAARDKFFMRVRDALVFRPAALKFFLDEHSLDNSYTRYENRIGLSNAAGLLSNNTDVVLNFPYKDCVLEGGQSTEEGKDSYVAYSAEKKEYEEKQSPRREIFFNEVLAGDEIDRLLDPKAFTNICRYTANGAEKLSRFNRDANGTIDENLIIRGNNLLALHSLKEEFSGLIRLIYIDPPYYFRTPKPDDTFAYNSNFRLSTWLLFMKSRLEASLDLLTDDGVIFISINEDGLAYLKVLMDELFRAENFIEVFSWKKTDTPSNLPHKSKKTLEYILCYEKKKDNVKFRGIQKTSSSNDPLTKPKNSEKTILFRAGTLQFTEKENYYKKGSTYGTAKYPMELLDDLTVRDHTNANDVRFRNRFIWVQENFDHELQNGTTIFCSKKSLVLSYKKKSYEVEAPFDLIDSSMGIQTSENAGKELTKMFGREVFKYPKSESLIEYLVNMAGNKLRKNDYILDFHLGSGTTAAVAHKLGYRYIGVEQLDYIHTLSVPRLLNVIRGDESGISQKLGWTGGGSFVYMELKQWNEEAKNRIRDSRSFAELKTLLKELEDKYFLHYNVKFAEFSTTIIHEEHFISLPLQQQKELVAKMLDLNQLYVNASEMEDKRFGMSENDITLTKSFYNNL